MPRRWVVIDFDDVPGPYRFDPRDGELAAIYCRTLLPEPWRRCSYWWGLSSSAGFKPGVRIKLAFWLDRPALGASSSGTSRAARSTPARCGRCSRSMSPGRSWSASPTRSGSAPGIEQDIHDAVTLPELPAEAARAGAATHSPDGRRYVSGSSEDVA